MLLCSSHRQIVHKHKLLSCFWLLSDSFCFLLGLWLISGCRCKNSQALCTRPCCFFLFALHDIHQACSWASYLFLRPTQDKSRVTGLLFDPFWFYLLLPIETSVCSHLLRKFHLFQSLLWRNCSLRKILSARIKQIIK